MSVDWVSLAVLGAAALGVVNIIDSHLISKRMPSFRAFLLLVGAIMLVYGMVIFYLRPLPEDVGTWPMVVAVTSAVFRLASVTIMLYILRTEEVSRVIPVFYIYPAMVSNSYCGRRSGNGLGKAKAGRYNYLAGQVIPSSFRCRPADGNSRCGF